MLGIALRKVFLSLTNWEHCGRKRPVDSIWRPQLHEGLIIFWKLYLNLCSLEWFKPSLNLVINLSLLGLWHLNLKVLVFKTDKLSAFPSPGFNFSHSMIVDAQIEFCFALRRWMFSAFLVECNGHLTRIKLIRYWGRLLFKNVY